CRRPCISSKMLLRSYRIKVPQGVRKRAGNRLGSPGRRDRTTSAHNRFCRYRSVEGELWKLGEDKQSPRRGRPKLVWVGIVGFVLICAATGMLVARTKSVKGAGNAAARGTPAVHLSSGLKVID